MHDARIYASSKLSTTVFPQSDLRLNGTPVSHFLLGDPAYPLTKNIIKNYPSEDTQAKENFNSKMNTIRVRVENAFGRLKGRFRFLSKKIQMKLNYTQSAILTCFILHNMLEMNGQPFERDWMHTGALAQPVARPVAALRDDGTGAMRDALANYLL